MPVTINRPRYNVFVIVNRTCGNSPADLNKLRAADDLRKDLHLDDMSITGMTPSLSSILAPIHQHVESTDVVGAKTIGDLVKLITDLISKETQQRHQNILNGIDLILSQLSVPHKSPSDIKNSDTIASLNLSPAADLCPALNKLLSVYDENVAQTSVDKCKIVDDLNNLLLAIVKINVTK